MGDIILRTYDELLAKNWTAHSVRQAVAAGRLTRVRRGVYADAAEMRAAYPEERVRARARAVQTTSSETLLFSHETAAALHGIPLYRPSADRVHTIARPERPGAIAGLIRHRGDVVGDSVEIEGIHCTSLTQTVADVARTATFERAVVVADAALRRECAGKPGEYDTRRASGFLESVEEIVRRSAHGRTRAQRVLRFADGRAQLPGESISRIRLSELGFRRIGLQHPVASPRGPRFFVDFAIDDAGAFGEFDGSIKYIDGRMLDDRTAPEVLDAEKQREDWIRGTTQRPLARWGWPHIDSAARLGARLAAFGIHPPA